MAADVTGLTNHRITHPRDVDGPRGGRILFEGGPADGVVLAADLPPNARPGFRMQSFPGSGPGDWYVLTEREVMTPDGPAVVAAHADPR